MTSSLEGNIYIAYSKQNDSHKPSVIRKFGIEQRHSLRKIKFQTFTKFKGIFLTK